MHQGSPIKRNLYKYGICSAAKFRVYMNKSTVTQSAAVTCLLVRLLIGSGPSAPQCLTCDLNPDRCQYNSAYFSFNASFYRMDCYGESGQHP